MTRTWLKSCALASCLILSSLVTQALAQSQLLEPVLDLDSENPMTQFGQAVAVHGRIAVVGAPDYAPYDPNSTHGCAEPFIGRVHIYQADVSRTAWSELTPLGAPDACDSTESYFGTAVALVDEGQHLVVTSSSRLMIYEKGKSGYTLVEKIPLTGGSLPPLVAHGDMFAFVSGDGVDVYRLGTRGKAHLMAKLPNPITSDQNLNSPIALSGDLLAIGASSRGAVYLYERRGEKWRLQSTVLAPNADAKGFGTGVALVGRRLLVGAPGEDDLNDPNAMYDQGSGAVYLFEKQAGQWTQTQRIRPVPGEPGVDFFVGFGTFIAANQHYAAFSAPQSPDFETPDEGEGYLYSWDGSQYNSPRSVGYFSAAALSQRYLVLGEDQDNSANAYQHEARVIDLDEVH